jgi:hypothetical protein
MTVEIACPVGKIGKYRCRLFQDIFLYICGRSISLLKSNQAFYEL